MRLTTSESGAYALPNLEPVIYRIKAEAPGFKAALLENVKVKTASATTVNVTLEVGATSATVNITAEAALRNAESSAQSAILSADDSGFARRQSQLLEARVTRV